MVIERPCLCRPRTVEVYDENFEPHHKCLSSAMKATLYANWVFFQTLYKKGLVSLVVAWKLDYETCFSSLFIWWWRCGRRPTHTHSSPWILCDRMSHSLQTVMLKHFTYFISSFCIDFNHKNHLKLLKSSSKSTSVAALTTPFSAKELNKNLSECRIIKLFFKCF